MKQYFKSLTVLLYLSICSCTDKNPIAASQEASFQISTAAINFDADPKELEQTVTIESNCEWTAKLIKNEADEWVVLDQKNGDKGICNIKVCVVPNNELNRYATIRFTYDDTYTDCIIAQASGDKGEISFYPTTPVTVFEDNFYHTDDSKLPNSDKWAFYSNDLDVGSDQISGWKYTPSVKGRANLVCNISQSKYTSLTNYAIMSPFNIKESKNRVLKFDMAWDCSPDTPVKLEVVASTNFKGNVLSADWKTLKDISNDVSFTASHSVQSVDLSQFSDEGIVYIAFRYIGKKAYWAIYNVEFGFPESSVEFDTHKFVPEDLYINNPVDGKIEIDYKNANGTEIYNVRIDVSGDGAADIFPKSRVITRQLTVGKGTVELPFKIPASVSGDITFTISGIRQCGVMDMNTSVSSADINLLGLKTLTPDAEYISRTTTTGWIAENASVQQGGNSNSDPMFQFIGSEDERAICLSGNKSVPGVLMSPVLNGFKFRGMEFGIAFDGYNQVDLLMEIIQNGKSVKSTRFQYEIPKFQMFIPGSDHLFDFEGICQVKITNLCPSNISNRNADQITIHRLYYWQYE